jgi:hypothetical protein
MMTSLFEPIQRGISRKLLEGQKNAPQLLFAGGVVGMVGSTVLACRATLKLDEVLTEVETNVRRAKAALELHPEQYTEEDRQKDSVIIYVRATAKVAKMYMPAAALGVVSIAALTKSHNILQERNIAITAAYVALEKGFSEYRQRVVDKYGEDEDRRLRYDTEVVAIGDKKNGKPQTIERVGPGAATIYARFFDELSQYWSKEPEYNALFLRCQQNYANDLLNARGHVFLNEVYDMLGIPRSEAGQVVGWLRSDRTTDGDGYIDFGVFHADGSDRIRDFVNGREGSVLVDFNVDGIIYNKIEEYKEAPSWQLER